MLLVSPLFSFATWVEPKPRVVTPVGTNKEMSVRQQGAAYRGAGGGLLARRGVVPGPPFVGVGERRRIRIAERPGDLLRRHPVIRQVTGGQMQPQPLQNFAEGRPLVRQVAGERPRAHAEPPRLLIQIAALQARASPLGSKSTSWLTTIFCSPLTECFSASRSSACAVRICSRRLSPDTIGRSMTRCGRTQVSTGCAKSTGHCNRRWTSLRSELRAWVNVRRKGLKWRFVCLCRVRTNQSARSSKNCR